jgi:hypothetical protein
MDLHRDYEEMLSELSSANVRFLVVGAYAVGYHSEPRYTKDLDLWVDPTPENAERVWTALARFGAPLKDIPASDFTDPKIIYQLGVEPIRIDILTSIDGCTFANAWKRRVRVQLGNVSCCVLGRNDLLRAKRAAGRPQDLRDIELVTGRWPRGGARRTQGRPQRTRRKKK